MVSTIQLVFRRLPTDHTVLCSSVVNVSATAPLEAKPVAVASTQQHHTVQHTTVANVHIPTSHRSQVVRPSTLTTNTVWVTSVASVHTSGKQATRHTVMAILVRTTSVCSAPMVQRHQSWIQFVSRRLQECHSVRVTSVWNVQIPTSSPSPAGPSTRTNHSVTPTMYVYSVLR